MSVVIPTLNESTTIGGLLERLSSQVFKNGLEIIVVDGGSHDGTREIASKFSKTKVLTCTQGVSKQRNLGASVALGELLVFLDSDTYPAVTFLSEICKRHSSHDFTVACPWFVPDTRRPDIHVIYAILNSLFFASQFRYHAGAGVCIATPRAVFNELGGFDETLQIGEDVDYIRRAASVGKHCHLLLPLITSARRFEQHGVLHTAWLYARISPALMFAKNDELRKLKYPVVRRSIKRVEGDDF